MSERVRSFLVVLEPHTRGEDAQRITNAIEMLHGVEAVYAGNGEHVTPDFLARDTARSELRTEVLAALTPSWAKRGNGQ